MPTIDLTETSDWNPEARSAGSSELDASEQANARGELGANESMDVTRVDSHQNSTNHQSAEADSDFEVSIRQPDGPPAFDASIPPVDQNIGRMLTAVMDGKPHDIRLISLIGIGGMGKVYEAVSITDPQSERFAVKIAKRSKDSAKVIARFELESTVLQKLDHPNIVRFKADGSFEPGTQFLAMELIDGPNIVEFAKQNKLSIKEKIALFAKVCDAVSYCHDQGFLHRDIKPANVLIEKSTREPILIDFGVVKLRNAIRTGMVEAIDDGSADVSTNGQLVGTIQYMSPEQAQRKDSAIDPRTDVYSLGVLLHEMLTGNPPISRDELKQHSLESIVAKITDEKDPFSIDLSHSILDSTRDEDSGLLSRISVILSEAISTDMDDRFGSVAEFKNELVKATRADSECNMVRPASRDRNLSCRVTDLFQDNLWKAISLCLIIALFVSIRSNKFTQSPSTAKDTNFESRSLFDPGCEPQFCETNLEDELKENDSIPPIAPKYFHDQQMVEESLYVMEKVMDEVDKHQVEFNQVVEVQKLDERPIRKGKNKLQWMIKPAPRQYFAGTEKVKKEVQQQTIQRFNYVIQNMDNSSLTQVKKLIKRIPNNALHKCMFNMDDSPEDMPIRIEY